MKKLVMAFSVFLAAGVAFAQSTTPPATPGDPPATGAGTAPAMSGDQAKAKEFAAEIVSVDAEAKTITVKKKDAMAADAGAPLTLSVDPKADASLKKVKAGDQVRLQCKTDATGKEIVSRIDKVDTRPAADQPPNP